MLFLKINIKKLKWQDFSIKKLLIARVEDYGIFNLGRREELGFIHV